jgi:hypothetical protein
VLERQPQRRVTPKAGGLGGRILELLRYRGLLERFEAACTDDVPAARFPFGGVHLDFTQLADRCPTAGKSVRAARRRPRARDRFQPVGWLVAGH